MKYTLAFLLLVITLASNAQVKIINHKNQPAYFVDSVVYKKFPILDINSIVEISVIKDDLAKYPNGAIFIKLKPEPKPNLITFEALAQQYVGATQSYMAMVDNEFITDLNGLMIDPSFVLSCEVRSTKDFVYLQHLPEIKIVQVTTATKENKEKAKKIMIRG